MKPGPLQVLIAIGMILTAMVALSGCRGQRSTEPRPPTANRAQDLARRSASVEGMCFENVSEQAGLRYRWPIQPHPMRILEAFGRGCAFLDYDNDGWLDILLVASPHPVLYHNLRNGW